MFPGDPAPPESSRALMAGEVWSLAVLTMGAIPFIIAWYEKTFQYSAINVFLGFEGLINLIKELH